MNNKQSTRVAEPSEKEIVKTRVDYRSVLEAYKKGDININEAISYCNKIV